MSDRRDDLPARSPGPQHGARRRLWWPWILIPAFVVVGVGGGLIGAAVASPNSTSSASGNSTTVNSAANSAAACAVTTVADDVLPSVVTISACGQGGAGTGSGEVIKSDGYILTNNHVIAIAADGGKVEVMFATGTTLPATIVGRDVLTDLAVLKVNPPKDLKVIALGS